MCGNCKRLEYERNKFEQMYNGKVENLMSEVRSIIGLELDSIKGIADRLPESKNLEKEQERLLRYIRRIKERITDLM